MRRTILITAAAALVVALAASPALAKDIFRIDFERPDDVQVVTGKGWEIVSPGNKSDKCIKRAVKGKYASVGFTMSETVPEGAVLAFDYRVEVESGKVAYVGVNFHTKDGKQTFSSVKPQTEWTHVELPLAKIKAGGASKAKGYLQVGDAIKALSIYGRADEKEAANTSQTLYLDNVRISTP